MRWSRCWSECEGAWLHDMALRRIATGTPQLGADDLIGTGAAKSAGKLPWNRFLVRIDVPDAVWAARLVLPRPVKVGWNAIPEGLVSR